MRIRYISLVVVLLTLSLVLTASAGTTENLDSPGPLDPDGLYSGSKQATANDSDPGASNIKNGVGLFVVIGTYPAPVEKTGQITKYADGDDGDLQKGVAWPNPRFTDNGDGTVTDNLTGLLWLKDANCTAFFFGDSTGQNRRSWSNALTAVNSLEAGYCGLTDGSSVGYWRLPNVKELESLIHYGVDDPALPNTSGTGKWINEDPFTDVQSDRYWSSTTAENAPWWTFCADMYDGEVYGGVKNNAYCYVWPVRGGGGNLGIASTYPAPVEKTGQTGCWDAGGNPIDCGGTGQDGEYQKGVAWPNPRFTDNDNGTVTDNLTGLLWLKNVNNSCFGQKKSWATALSDANNLEAGYCGLADGSSAGDWRLPNVKELESLPDFSQYGPALPSGHPFSGVQSGEEDYYWSSTTVESGVAWSLRMYYGDITDTIKTNAYYVWPVREYYYVFLPVILKNSDP
jgi:hypothetical protein